MTDDNKLPPGRPSPFADPEHSEVLVSREVMERGAQIMHVMHHESGKWGFYTSSAQGFRDVVTVALEEVLRHDSGVFYLRGLERGGSAIRAGDRWIFSEKKKDDEKGSKAPSGCMVVFLIALLGVALVAVISVAPVWFR